LTENFLKEQTQIVIVGHVDHGKSTLIGRLLYDTDSLPDGKFEELKAASEKRGMPLEWSFVLDAFQAERDQAVTIDTTRIWFKTDKRDYVIIDAPGHREFLKNMISGAASADAAVLVVDAEEGVQEQTRRHAYLLHLLGLKQVLVAVNKMDVVQFSAQRFGEVCQEIEEYLAELGVSPMAIVPISARHGDNIAKRSDEMPWYEGSLLLTELDRFEPVRAATEQPLRFPVQDVYRFDEKRVIVGRIEAGVLRVGETIIFSPANRVAKITSIEKWPENPGPVEAHAGDVVGITLDEPIYVERGDVASHEKSAPILTNVFRGHVFWLSDKPLLEGAEYKLKLGTFEGSVCVQSIDKVVNTNDLKGGCLKQVKRNEMAEITLRSRAMLALDAFQDNHKTGRCVLIDNYDVVGGGIISMEGYPDQRSLQKQATDNLFEVDHILTPKSREVRNGHKGAVIWFTGLSGSGKSTLAMEVEKRLFNKGYQTYVLDGDNVRTGLNAGLTFSPEDRAENIRRVGEVASLMADAGLVVISAFISPYRADRKRARSVAKERFHEVYIKADVLTCEGRDPKGLYKKARSGQIQDFTGISSPYEAPDTAELIVDTMSNDIDTCVAQVVDYVENNIRHQTEKLTQLAKA